MDSRKLHTSKFLSAADIEGPQIAVIDGITTERMKDFNGGADVDKTVLLLRGLKPLPLNATNIKVLENLFGFETDSWENQRVKLFTVEVQVRDEIKSAIRIRQAPVARPAGRPVATRQPQREPELEDIPFE